MTNPGVSVVVPVYNNASTLSELTRRICETVVDRPLEIVMVDDRSTDDSLETIEGLEVRVVTHEQNQGQNAAILSGLRAATQPLSCVLDADLEDPPEAIPALLAGLGGRGAQVVFSSREEKRLASSRLFRWLIHRLFPSLPPGPCLCLALNGAARVALLKEASGRDYLPAVIGALGLTTAHVPVARGIRPSGRSAYARTRRLRYASRMVMAALRRRWGN